MDFEFDPKKNASNLARHGIDFIQAQKLWKGPHAIVPAGMVADEFARESWA